MSTYRSFKVFQDETIYTKITTEEKPALKEGEVLIKVAYSSLNYKDALATQPKTGVVRQYPLTLGIDLAGRVLESTDSRYQVGDQVIATSFGLGVSENGGFSELQKVPSDWIVPLPKNMSLKEAMSFGTAGFTAYLAFDALKQHGLKTDSHVVVTGATGGVGSVALGLLKSFGCQHVTALSRKSELDETLKHLGATTAVTPDAFFPEKNRPLGKQQADFVIDTVGGNVLSQLLPLISYGGSIAACGNAAGIKLETTVLPFILRAVNLLGIDSVETPMPYRAVCWEELAENTAILENMNINQITMEQIPESAAQLLAGTHVGRTIVKIAEEE